MVERVEQIHTELELGLLGDLRVLVEERSVLLYPSVEQVRPAFPTVPSASHLKLIVCEIEFCPVPVDCRTGQLHSWQFLKDARIGNVWTDAIDISDGPASIKADDRGALE